MTFTKTDITQKASNHRNCVIKMWHNVPEKGNTQGGLIKYICTPNSPHMVIRFYLGKPAANEMDCAGKRDIIYKKLEPGIILRDFGFAV